MRFVSIAALLAVLISLNASASSTVMNPPIVRRDLLTAAISPHRPLARVEIKAVTLAPHLAAGLHLHPCPVVGVVTAGHIAFQLEGGPLQRLGPGDAFHEPAGVRVRRFDNAGDTPATFTAFYLLGPDEHELIHLLDR